MSRETTSTSNNTRVILLSGTVAALTTAFLDLSLSVLSHSHVLWAFGHLLAPIAATTVAALVVYLLLFYLVVRPVGRMRGADVPSLAVASASFLVTLFLLIAMYELRLSPTNLFRFVLSAVVAFSVAVGTYSFCLRAYEAPLVLSRASALGLFVPWIAGAALVFAWVEVLRIRSPHSAAALAAAVLFAAVVAALLVLARRLAATAWPRRALVVLLCVVVVTPASALFSRGGQGRDRAKPIYNHAIHHVFLIVVDTLRRDALSCYGSNGAPTPNIDRLADDGATFLSAVSASSWTLPSMCSIMSGLEPAIHGTIHSRQALDDSVRTIADMMRGDGYETSAIGCNPMLSRAHNLTQGFDEYQWYPRPADDISAGKRILRALFPEAYRVDITTEGLSDAAIEWARRNRDRDAFLWLHYFDPHHPYAPPKRFLPEGSPPPAMGPVFEDRKEIQAGLFAPSAAQREWIKSLYLGEVRYVDEQVGRLLDALRSMGLYDDSLIILTSDHGEEFWEHGGFEHGHTLYHELLDVPLIVKPPRSTAPARLSELVPTQGIASTIMEICGVEHDPAYMARSLAPLVQGRTGDYDVAPVFSGGLLYFEDRSSVTSERFKYIYSSVSRKEQLFDRLRDPGEQHPLGPGSEKALAEARNTLDEHLKKVPEARDYLHIRGGWQADLAPETVRRLKALGYL
jgi:arylsulfatase A-like enzyme